MCVMTSVTRCNNTDWIYSFANHDLMIRHHGGGIGHLQDFCSVDHKQNGMVQENSWAVGDGMRPRGESNVADDSDSELETDYDMGSGSEMSDNDYSEGVESDSYVTPWYYSHIAVV